jgi:hypothetical protein
MPPQGTGALDYLAEVGMELGRTPGDVQRRNGTLLQQPEAGLQDLPRHALWPLGSGIHMAVSAGLITALPDIDLQHLDAASLEWLRLRHHHSLRKRAQWQVRQEALLGGGRGEGMPLLLERRDQLRDSHGETFQRDLDSVWTWPHLRRVLSGALGTLLRHLDETEDILPD